MTAPPEIKRQISGQALSARAAADLLAISLSELKRRSLDGIYPFYVDKKGWRWYSEATLRSLSTVVVPERVNGRALLREEKKRLEASGTYPVNVRPQEPAVVYDQEIAAKVFARLKKGEPTVDIVIELSIHPEIVDEIAKVYQRMSKTLHLDNAHRTALEKLPLQGELPITDGDHLIRVLTQSLLAPNPCVSCGHDKARVCARCAGGHPMQPPQHQPPQHQPPQHQPAQQKGAA